MYGSSGKGMEVRRNGGMRANPGRKALMNSDFLKRDRNQLKLRLLSTYNVASTNRDVHKY